MVPFQSARVASRSAVAQSRCDRAMRASTSCASGGRVRGQRPLRVEASLLEFVRAPDTGWRRRAGPGASPAPGGPAARGPRGPPGSARACAQPLRATPRRRPCAGSSPAPSAARRPPPRSVSRWKGRTALTQRAELQDVVPRIRQILRPLRGRRRADVAERGELLDLLRVRRARRLARPGQREHLRAQGPKRRRQTGGEVISFLRVCDDVEELRPRPVDVLIAFVGQRSQVAPTEVVARKERLGCRSREASHRPPVPRRAAKLPGAPAAARGRAARRRSERRPPGRPGARRVRSGAARSRQLHEERHVQVLAVEEQAVLVLAVVAEPLAMVGHHDDHTRSRRGPAPSESRRTWPAIASAVAISPS